MLVKKQAKGPSSLLARSLNGCGVDELKRGIAETMSEHYLWIDSGTGENCRIAA